MMMNNEMQSLRPVNERLLDRLVDNELDAAGSRGLLKALDESPDGWRRGSPGPENAIEGRPGWAGRTDRRGGDPLLRSRLAGSPGS